MNSREKKYFLTTFNTGVFTLKLRLPSDIWCTQCILQWTYTVRITHMVLEKMATSSIGFFYKGDVIIAHLLFY